jgi:hypothetical protein
MLFTLRTEVPRRIERVRGAKCDGLLLAQLLDRSFFSTVVGKFVQLAIGQESGDIVPKMCADQRYQ